MNNMINIIKLGGAAITDKRKENTLKKDRIDSVMKEIGYKKGKIILVHGAGSFGHVDAKKYQLRDGYSNAISFEEQLKGISKIKSNLKILDDYICTSAINHKINPFTLSISSILISSGDDNETVFFDSLDHCLDLGLMPVLSGDMCFDKKTGFRVVSGDRIIKLIGKHYTDKNIRVIFGTDIDGLFESDPNIEPDTKLIENLDLERLNFMIEKAGGSAGIDVTGGMRGKLLEIKEIIKLGIEVVLVNITCEGRLSKVLNEKNVICTTIKK